MNRKPIFFTSDLHLNHANSIKFDNRPFQDLEEMHRKIITQWNHVVPENGIVYILGDIGMGKKDSLKVLIEQLKGTKVLILGNHDGGVNSMYNVGFDAVLNSASITIANELVTMTHCPLRGIPREDLTGLPRVVEGDNWHGESKHRDISVEDQGQFHLHGHIHSPNHGKSVKILGRQMDVGMPANNYRPVSLSTIESFIAKTKRDENKD